MRSKEKRGRPTRDVVVSFRLRTDELSLLRATHPANGAPPPRSRHKLVRAVVLARLENPQVMGSPEESKSKPCRLNVA
jgi:hypothetical protein